MRELSLDDMRWVAGGLPASGTEGETVYENGSYYTYIDGSWVENLIVEYDNDPTPETPYTWDDFLADQASADFLSETAVIEAGLVRDALVKIANTLDDWASKWKDINGNYIVYDKDGDGDRDLTDLASIVEDLNDAHIRQLIQNTVDNTPNTTHTQDNDLVVLFRASGEATLEAFFSPLAQWVDALQHDDNEPLDLRGPV